MSVTDSLYPAPETLDLSQLETREEFLDFELANLAWEIDVTGMDIEGCPSDLPAAEQDELLYRYGCLLNTRQHLVAERDEVRRFIADRIKYS